MDRPVNMPIRVGAWYVDPIAGQISKGAEIVRVEARTMRLLLYLAQRAGEVVSVDELLSQVWAGVVVTPASVYQAVTSLRRLLSDDPKAPRYIATVPRLGYRMVADVEQCVESQVPSVDAPPVNSAATPPLPAVSEATAVKTPQASWKTAFAVASVVLVTLSVAFWAHAHWGAGSRVAIAVLPFSDLTTQEMNEEFFADGLTEELIGDLSRIPTFQVPAPTTVFYYKGKQLSVAEIARQLGVTYILDGSVRKSDNTYRVATRLIRVDNGFVVWSENYDRPLGNLVQVQKDIATEATQSVGAALAGIR